MDFVVPQAFGRAAALARPHSAREPSTPHSRAHAERRRRPVLCSTKSKHAIHSLKHRGGVPTRRDSVPACYISPSYDGRERQHGGAGAVADNVGSLRSRPAPAVLVTHSRHRLLHFVKTTAAQERPTSYGWVGLGRQGCAPKNSEYFGSEFFGKPTRKFRVTPLENRNIGKRVSNLPEELW